MKKKPAHNLSVVKSAPAALRLVTRHEADPRIKKRLGQVARLLLASPRPDEALTDAAARIEAVTHMHRLLAKMQNGGRRTVALDDFMNALADTFVDGTADQSQTVLLVNADAIQVPGRVAAMFGQIASELIIAVKHAIGSTRPGTIQIDCGTDADGTIRLQISDDEKNYIESSVSVRLAHSRARS